MTAGPTQAPSVGSTRSPSGPAAPSTAPPEFDLTSDVCVGLGRYCSTIVLNGTVGLVGARINFNCCDSSLECRHHMCAMKLLPSTSGRTVARGRHSNASTQAPRVNEDDVDTGGSGLTDESAGAAFGMSKTTAYLCVGLVLLICIIIAICLGFRWVEHQRTRQFVKHLDAYSCTSPLSIHSTAARNPWSPAHSGQTYNSALPYQYSQHGGLQHLGSHGSAVGSHRSGFHSPMRTRTVVSSKTSSARRPPQSVVSYSTDDITNSQAFGAYIPVFPAPGSNNGKKMAYPTMRSRTGSPAYPAQRNAGMTGSINGSVNESVSVLEFDDEYLRVDPHSAAAVQRRPPPRRHQRVSSPDPSESSHARGILKRSTQAENNVQSTSTTQSPMRIMRMSDASEAVYCTANAMSAAAKSDNSDTGASATTYNHRSFPEHSPNDDIFGVPTTGAAEADGKAGGLHREVSASEADFGSSPSSNRFDILYVNRNKNDLKSPPKERPGILHQGPIPSFDESLFDEITYGNS